MLKTPTVANERVCALFPVTGGDTDSGWRQIESFVVTTDEYGKFTLRHLRHDSDGPGFPTETFTTFPKALRAARKACGWG